MSEGKISVAKENGITTITFFHPQSNSMPGKLLFELAEAIKSSGDDKDVKVIILKSEGEKAFCAGASFDELVSIENIEQGKKFFSGFAAVINAMRKAPKFVIARVQGKAVGGGVGIASAADYTLAHESASVKLSELAVGIGPFVVGPAVERKIGKSAFSALTINATAWQDAVWAKQCGLYAEVFSSINALDSAVDSLAKTLAASNPDAMKELKKIFWRGTEDWDQLLAERAEMSGKLVLSEFTRNAIAKFKAGVR
ncbi:MAG: enoyl-CoA hydratase/isomerase family protein [Bacteroidetes bacterium]|nr:MAG: enoyl-CoA hydratase/isomerase family protein [Bacteroidota bacterium]REK05043.1 MAG: enoyl-CoA hydratase/isomerase family protein [Bacteroidota bacterium]REK36454.1 MAG: enoyl-CoA hydratase/isomerase family protein [Bacteroidota bacterium]REK51668.1 MAG: enoyl-CoA hydratase/isomerase family protein [Bacteroidota bacterium]